jgi:hypothetical protein
MLAASRLLVLPALLILPLVPFLYCLRLRKTASSLTLCIKSLISGLTYCPVKDRSLYHCMSLSICCRRSFLSAWVTSARPTLCQLYVTRQVPGGWQSVKKRRRFVVVTTFKKSNTNSPVWQQMLKLLPSWPDALHIPAKEVLVYSLEFFLGNCWILKAHLVSWVFQSAGICFMHFKTSPQTKVTVCKIGETWGPKTAPNYAAAFGNLAVGDVRLAPWITASVACKSLLSRSVMLQRAQSQAHCWTRRCF